jgi:hypothetical protein
MPVAFPTFGTGIRPLGDVHHSINRNVVMLVLMMIDRYSLLLSIAFFCSPPPYFSAPVSYPKWSIGLWFCLADASTNKLRSPPCGQEKEEASGRRRKAAAAAAARGYLS